MAIQSDLVIKGLIDIALKGDGSKQAVDSLRRIIAETEKLDAEQKKQLSTAKASEVIERAKASTARQSASAQVTAANQVTAAKKREETQAKETSAAHVKGSQQALVAARQLYAFFATGVLIAFVKSSLTEYAKTERALNSLTAQLRLMGDESVDVGVKVRAFVEGLSKQTGILDDELIPALNIAVLRFRDYAAAQEALTIASRFAANGIGTVESNVESLAQAIQTGTGRGLDDFGVTLKKTASGAVDLADAINQVRTNAGALPEKLDDAQARLGAFARMANEARNAIARLADVLAHGLEQQLTSAKELQERFRAGMFDVKVPRIVYGPENESALEKEARERQAALDKDYNERRAKEAAEAAEAQRKAEEAFLQERDRMQAEDIRGALQKLDEMHAEELAKEMAHARQLIDLKMQENEQRRQLAIEAGDAQAELDAALFEERLASVKEGSEQYTTLLLEQIDNEEQARLAALEREKAAVVTAGLFRVKTAEEVAAQLAIIEKKITAEQIKASTARKLIIEAEKATQMLAWFQAAANMVSALETMFGESKAFSIAAAIINTLQGVTLALATIPMPAGAAVAASVMAMGFAQVAKIQSTRPGSGGGGEAGLGAIPAPPPPVSQGQQAAAAGAITNVTNNQATTQNVSMGYPVRNKIEARRMARRLNRLGTADPKRAW